MMLTALRRLRPPKPPRPPRGTSSRMHGNGVGDARGLTRPAPDGYALPEGQSKHEPSPAVTAPAIMPVVIVATRMPPGTVVARAIRRPPHKAAMTMAGADTHLDIATRIPVPIPVAVVARRTPRQRKRHQRQHGKAKCFSPHGYLPIVVCGGQGIQSTTHAKESHMRLTSHHARQ
jgi:hypothetical protein